MKTANISEVSDLLFKPYYKLNTTLKIREIPQVVVAALNYNPNSLETTIRSEIFRIPGSKVSEHLMLVDWLPKDVLFDVNVQTCRTCLSYVDCKKEYGDKTSYEILIEQDKQHNP